MGWGVFWLWKSKVPQRPQRRYAAGSSPHSSERGNAPAPSPPCARSCPGSCRAPRSRADGCPTCRPAPAPCRRKPGRPNGCSAPAGWSGRRCAPPPGRRTVRRGRRPPPPRPPAPRPVRRGRAVPPIADLCHVYSPGCVPKKCADRWACARHRGVRLGCGDPRRQGCQRSGDRVQRVLGCWAVALRAAQCDCSGFHLMSQRSTRVMIRKKLPDKAAHRTIAAYSRAESKA